MICLSILLCLILSSNAYAQATPTQWEYDADYEDGLNDEEIEIFDAFDFESAAESDRSASELIKDIFITALQEVLPPEEEEFEPDVSYAVDRGEEIVDVDVSDDGEMVVTLQKARASEKDDYHKNVVVFHGSFNNYDCDLVVPYDSYKYLDIIDGKLVNVGSGTVTGRILYDDETLDITKYDTYSYVINPIYGSTSNVYRYGAFNYRRHYFVSSGNYPSITYEDMYGNFLVDDVDVYYSASERVYYLLMVMLTFMGVIWLWDRRH